MISEMGLKPPAATSASRLLDGARVSPSSAQCRPGAKGERSRAPDLV